MKKLKILLFLCVVACTLTVQAQKQFTLNSPDGKIQTTITVSDKLTYDICCYGRQILAPSPISMTLDNGEVWGEKAKLSGTSGKKVDQMIPSPFYRASELRDHYNELTLRFKKDWNVEFRAYNDGIAYRFVSRAKKPFNVVDETVDYHFPSDMVASVPYVKTGKDGDYNSQYFNSFENTYTTDPLSKLNKKRLMFLPLVVDAGEGVKVCITESDLENYPGLYLSAIEGENRLTGRFAPYPKKMVQGGHNQLQMLVKERENYIAKTSGTRSFPWRAFIISRNDKELADCDMVYRLASPSRVNDISWIKPGKVAWDWWNDWNLYGVDFRAGINNPTYKYYIDFAAEHGIEYVILDEGWSVNMAADLMQVIPEIDIPELVNYGKSKNVGIILWAGYHAFDRDMEKVVKHYSNMGVKGFKVDFMDRDDQEIVNFLYRGAETCAKYKMMVDYHGICKPTGLQRTYPNVINYEGVHGLENMKWVASTYDMPLYDVTIPFVRMVAGPMDYTQGAMRNAIRKNYAPIYTEPMSQGTRCHQLATYVIFESPLNMLCDNPSNYNREPECTEFIANIPTVWEKTVALDGKVGEFVAIARLHGNDWYVGALTNWDAREVELDLSFLGDGNYKLELFKDGINADRAACDYKKEVIPVPADRKVKVKMAPGGGWAAKIYK